MMDKQNYHIIREYCFGNNGDGCVYGCQTGNFLAGHLATLIRVCKERGLIDDNGYLVEAKTPQPIKEEV